MIKTQENFALQRFKALIILVFAFLSVHFIGVAPLELKKVYEVEKFDKIQVYLLRIETKTFGKSNSKYVGAMQFYDKSTNKIVRINDFRAGDIENDVLSAIFSNQSKFAKTYKANTQIYVYRSKDKREYFLERGDYKLMSILLLLSAFFWFFVIFKIFQAIIYSIPKKVEKA